MKDVGRETLGVDAGAEAECHSGLVHHLQLFSAFPLPGWSLVEWLLAVV